MPKGRFYCFTSFDTDRHIPFDKDAVAYIIYQKERCPTTGRQHWQGFVAARAPCNRTEIQSVLGHRGHVELCRGGADANIAYCSKEDGRIEGPFEYGDKARLEQPGRRTDLDVISERAKHPGGLSSIIEDYPAYFVKYHRGLIALRANYLGVRDPATPPDVRVHVGPSGAGKTRAVYDERGGSEIYQKDGSKWWDGYDGQPIILMDDFAGSDEIPPTELLKILDRYPHRVQTKGGYVQLAPATIILTTMVSHEEWYKGSEAWRKQIIPFERRVTKWRHFGAAEVQEVEEAQTEVVDPDNFLV